MPSSRHQGNPSNVGSSQLVAQEEDYLQFSQQQKVQQNSVGQPQVIQTTISQQHLNSQQQQQQNNNKNQETNLADTQTLFKQATIKNDSTGTQPQLQQQNGYVQESQTSEQNCNEQSENNRSFQLISVHQSQLQYGKKFRFFSC